MLVVSKRGAHLSGLRAGKLFMLNPLPDLDNNNVGNITDDCRDGTFWCSAICGTILWYQAWALCRSFGGGLGHRRFIKLRKENDNENSIINCWKLDIPVEALADIKTMTAHGGAIAITALTAQNTTSVTGIME